MNTISYDHSIKSEHLRTIQTERNGGLLSVGHYERLKAMLEGCIELYKSPSILHIRVTNQNHEEQIKLITPYIQTRLRRQGITFSYVKAIENKYSNTWLHSHWFVVVETNHPDLTKEETLEEVMNAFGGLKSNGLIQSYRVNPKKIEGAWGTNWVEQEDPWFDLSPQTFNEAVRWCVYACKCSTKTVEGRVAVTFSMPRPVGTKSTKGRRPAARACLRRGGRHGF